MNRKTKTIIEKLRGTEILDAIRALADETAAHLEEREREYHATSDWGFGIVIRHSTLRGALLSIAENHCCHCCGEAARVAKAALELDTQTARADEARRDKIKAGVK